MFLIALWLLKGRIIKKILNQTPGSKVWIKNIFVFSFRNIIEGLSQKKKVGKYDHLLNPWGDIPMPRSKVTASYLYPVKVIMACTGLACRHVY